MKFRTPLSLNSVESRSQAVAIPSSMRRERKRPVPEASLDCCWILTVPTPRECAAAMRFRLRSMISVEPPPTSITMELDFAISARWSLRACLIARCMSLISSMPSTVSTRKPDWSATRSMKVSRFRASLIALVAMQDASFGSTPHPRRSSLKPLRIARQREAVSREIVPVVNTSRPRASGFPARSTTSNPPFPSTRARRSLIPVDPISTTAIGPAARSAASPSLTPPPFRSPRPRGGRRPWPPRGRPASRRGPSRPSRSRASGAPAWTPRRSPGRALRTGT